MGKDGPARFWRRPGPPLRRPPCRSDRPSCCRGKPRALPQKRLAGGRLEAGVVVEHQCAICAHAPMRPCARARAKYAGPVDPRVQPSRGLPGPQKNISGALPPHPLLILRLAPLAGRSAPYVSPFGGLYRHAPIQTNTGQNLSESTGWDCAVMEGRCWGRLELLEAVRRGWGGDGAGTDRGDGASPLLVSTTLSLTLPRGSFTAYDLCGI